MGEIARLGIEVDSRGVRRANTELGKFTKTTTGAEKATSNLESSWRSFGSFITAGTIAFGLRSIVRATSEQQKATAQLAAGLRSTENASGQTMESLQALADEMQRTTVFGDELVESAEAILLSFTNISGEAFPATIRAAADVATRMGTDLRSAVVQLGKALNEPLQNLSALSRSGIQFSKEQKELIRTLVETGRQAEAQAIILQELERQYGGSAEAARETLGGAIQALSNSWSDFKENLGTGLESAIRPILDGLSFVFQNIERWVKRATFSWLTAWTEIKFTTLEIWAILKFAWNAYVSFVSDSWDKTVSLVTKGMEKLLTVTAKAMLALEQGAAALGGNFQAEWSDPIFAAAADMRKISRERLRDANALATATKQFDQEILALEEERRDTLQGITSAEEQSFIASEQARTAAIVAAQQAVVAQEELGAIAAKANETVVRTAEKMPTIADEMGGIWRSFSSNLVDSLFDAEKRASLTFESIASDFAKSVAKMLAQQALLRAVGLPSVFTPQAVTASAHGNVFSGGRVTPFARGGMINRPTTFPMANGGMGLAGEAGPEAIFPLTRTRSGDLGVKAEGAATTVLVNIVNNTGARVAQARRTTERGTEIDVVIGDAVSQAISSGRLDQPMRDRFGVSTLGARRG
jgi:hypothetical protein